MYLHTPHLHATAPILLQSEHEEKQGITSGMDAIQAFSHIDDTGKQEPLLKGAFLLPPLVCICVLVSAAAS